MARYFTDHSDRKYLRDCSRSASGLSGLTLGGVQVPRRGDCSVCRGPLVVDAEVASGKCVDCGGMKAVRL